MFAGLITSVGVKLTKKGKKMANFVLEDTTGHVEGVCFKYDDFQDALQEDAIVKVKGKFEHSDRGDQIMAFEVERLELDEAHAGPSHLEIKLNSSDFDAATSAQLQQILRSHPGRDAVVLKKFSRRTVRSSMLSFLSPVDVTNNLLYSEILDLFGRPVWKAS